MLLVHVILDCRGVSRVGQMIWSHQSFPNVAKCAWLLASCFWRRSNCNTLCHGNETQPTEWGVGWDEIDFIVIYITFCCME